MATKELLTTSETYWDQQRKTLSRVRQNSRGPFSPLDDSHPLLKRSRASPKQLPRLSPEPHRRSPALRGSKFERVPPVVNVSYDRERFGSPAGYDSWGEEGDSDDDYPTAPYPVLMYPMMAVPAPARNKHRGRSKKRVRYRNTPTYLNSRENTKHEPVQQQQPVSSQFSYIHPATQSSYNPFDPSMNPVVAKYLPNPYDARRSTRHSPPPPQPDASLVAAHKHLNDSWLFSTQFVEDFLTEVIEGELAPDIVKEVLTQEEEDRGRQSRGRGIEYQPENGYILRNDPLEEFMNGLLEDVVIEESVLSVKAAVHELVDEHLARAAAYDIMGDIFDEILTEEAPEVVDEALFECLLDDIIQEMVVAPETEDTIQEVAIETLDKYNDKKRRKEIKEVKRLTGEKLIDSFCLDYLLALTARQGHIFTEGEHANKLFDSMLLNMLLCEHIDVSGQRKQTVDNKAIRRMHEKMTTDVAMDVVLEELCRCLDQDMLDLDEYEHGYMDDNQQHMQQTSDLQKWLAGT